MSLLLTLCAARQVRSSPEEIDSATNAYITQKKLEIVLACQRGGRARDIIGVCGSPIIVAPCCSVDVPARWKRAGVLAPLLICRAKTVK